MEPLTPKSLLLILLLLILLIMLVKGLVLSAVVTGWVVVEVVNNGEEIKRKV